MCDEDTLIKQYTLLKLGELAMLPEEEFDVVVLSITPAVKSGLENKYRHIRIFDILFMRIQAQEVY